RRHGLRRQEADTAATLGVLCGLQGNFESAEAACRTAVNAAEAVADERRVAACLQAWAAVQAWQGRYEDALETLERAELLAESRGDLLRLYALGGVRAFAQAGAKHFAEAQSSFDAALVLGRELGAESYRPLFMAWLAEACFEAGQGETALLSAREAFRLAAEANRPWPRSIALRTLARVLAHPEVGDLPGALKAARSALAEPDGLGLSFEIARTQIAYAKILRASGELERSSRAYAQASVLFQKMRMTGEYDSAKTLAEALRPTGG
ncbi:MAG TPA: hypothetical protein VLL72_09010, partial [Kiloniellales bacterium]|nr:hypothetical protein [Kiloniellales bacterium]